MNTLASQQTIDKTVEALKANNFNTIVVENGAEAMKKVLEMIPEGAEVMTATSVTLDTIGLTEALNESGKYDAVKKKLMSMNRETQGLEMQKLGAAPEYIVGSVHAVTEEGHVLIASNSGSQLPGYTYGSPHVIWVVSTKKIVKDDEEGKKRVYEHVLPLESVRAHKAYGVPGSFVSKLLYFNREPNPTRITMILVKEDLGY